MNDSRQRMALVAVLTRAVVPLAVAALACGVTASVPESASEEPGPPPAPIIRAEELPDTSSELTGFATAMLAAHNACRAPFDVPELEWSTDLAAFAQEWADDLARTDDRLQHRKNNPYGENLYWISGAAATPEQVLGSWCAEEELFDLERNDWWPNAAHFSQVVWRGTERVGCAVARRGRQEWWVCNYDPPGNLRGRRPY